MRKGFSGCRPNDRIATALVLEANLWHPYYRHGESTLERYCKRWEQIIDLIYIEKKTGKTRTFTVPLDIYSYIQAYCINHGIKPNERIFAITERAVQKQLKIVCDYLGYENISTHSFRKFFATEIYLDNNYNLILVQQLLQHSSPAITQRYIGINSKVLEDALEKHVQLI